MNNSTSRSHQSVSSRSENSTNSRGGGKYSVSYTLRSIGISMRGGEMGGLTSFSENQVSSEMDSLNLSTSNTFEAHPPIIPNNANICTSPVLEEEGEEEQQAKEQEEEANAINEFEQASVV
jgi:hypothetical protein